MSDSRRRYYAVKTKLRQLLPELWAECESRMTNLSLMVSAIPKAKELTQSAIAAEMPVAAQDTSLVQRQRRWVKNEQLDERLYYRPLISPFLQALSRTTVPIILDTTEMGLNNHMLMVAVGYQRRALPIVWQAGQGSRGHTEGDLQVGLLNYTAQLLAPTADVIILGDGEFGHVQLLSWLHSRQPSWAYCLRVASDTYILFEGQWRRLDSFQVRPGETIWLEQVYLTRQATFGPVNIWLTWDPKHKRLVPVVTNLVLADEVAYWYTKRPWIEPLFGDVKGHGFDLQTCRLRHPARLDRLMLAVALAYLWMCFLGAMALMTGHAKFVDRSDRRDRSIFTIGRLWLNRLSKLDFPIRVGFLPFPFPYTIPPVRPG
ncbi:MAG: transposase [Anaerolineae bacterium]|jgi:hypothetical protein|nr:transposase [Anaerolineae bacterium]